MIPGRLTVVTIGVRDLASLREFYKRLGWEAVIELEDDVTVFGLRGAILALFPIDQLADDGRVEAAAPTGGIAASLAVNVDERDQVDEALEAARAAGARVTKEPVDAEWGGRTAYFADPEDNYWEIAWVPPDSNMAAAIARASG
ncbi:MAG: VOC family protein [Thermoleophilaceae bacterium]